jgi:hypothetical protein
VVVERDRRLGHARRGVAIRGRRRGAVLVFAVVVLTCEGGGDWNRDGGGNRGQEQDVPSDIGDLESNDGRASPGSRSSRVPCADASRAPTSRERAAIKRLALKACEGGPNPCRFHKARISTKNARYAWSDVTGEGFSGALLKRANTRSAASRSLGRRAAGSASARTGATSRRAVGSCG